MTLFRKNNILMQKLSQLHHYHHCYSHCTMLNCTRDCRIRKTIASISYIIETVGGKHLFLNKLFSASSETYQSITFNMYCNKGTSHAICPDHHARMNRRAKMFPIANSHPNIYNEASQVCRNTVRVCRKSIKCHWFSTIKYLIEIAFNSVEQT